MKLLFDQNLSFRLATALGEVFPGSSQVRLLGLDRADDLTIWARAAEDGYTLVTQDADFGELSAFHGSPPKVIWLRCGNRPTAFIQELLTDNARQILLFERTPEIDCLELG